MFSMRLIICVTSWYAFIRKFSIHLLTDHNFVFRNLLFVLLWFAGGLTAHLMFFVGGLLLLLFALLVCLSPFAFLLLLDLLAAFLGFLDCVPVAVVNTELVVWIEVASCCTLATVEWVLFFEFVVFTDANEVAAVVWWIFNQLAMVQTLF